MKLYEIINPSRTVYSKKVDDLAKIDTINYGNSDSKYKVGSVIFDNDDGLGVTPNNKEIKYFGFTATMRIDIFLKLVAHHRGTRDESANDINELLQQGYGIATPMLYLKIQDLKEPTISAQVMGHEGRARVICCQKFYDITEIPIHVIPTGLRARNMTEQIINQLNKNGINSEEPPHSLIKNPFVKIILP